MFFAQELSADELYLMCGYNVAVPPYVRQASTITICSPRSASRRCSPNGLQDAVVRPAAVDQHKALMPHAQVHLIANAGHAPFWDDAPTFNQHLRALCESL
jgi:hypothetical protein